MLALVLATTLAAPHASLQVFFQSQCADAAWQKAVFDKVAHSFVASSAKPVLGKKSVVQLLLSRNGTVASAQLTLESGSKEWDAAALASARRASPFPRLPASCTGASLEAHVHLGWVP